MKQEAARLHARPIAFGDWIASLQIEIAFSPATTDDEKARVVQLAGACACLLLRDRLFPFEAPYIL